MQNPDDDTDHPMSPLPSSSPSNDPTTTTSTSLLTPQPPIDDLTDPTLDLLTSDSPPPASDPDTPPPTTHAAHFPHLSSSQTTLGLETPPPTTTTLQLHHGQLMTPGPTGTPPSSQPHQHKQGRESTGSMLGAAMGMSYGQGQQIVDGSRKNAAEQWAAAGWGGKKMVEDYEMQREKLLDQGFSIAFRGDDYNESDMWQ